MHKNARIVCTFTCIVGALGFFIRWLQNTNDFEADTGFLRTGAATGVVLFFFCIFTTGVLFFFVRRLSMCESSTEFYEAFRTRSIFAPLICLLAALIAFTGAVMLFFTADKYSFPSLQRSLAPFAVLLAISLPVFGLRQSGRKSDRALLCLMSMLPVIFYSFWLITSYKENSMDPSIWSFAVEVFAIGVSAMAFFYLSGFAFGKARPLHTIFFCQLAAFLCFLTLADTRPVAKHLLFLASSIIFLFTSYALISNMKLPLKRTSGN